nr:hypothetical protein [Saccharopolyspora erythraea]
MRGDHGDAGQRTVFQQHVRRRLDGATSADHVVHDQHRLRLDIAHQFLGTDGRSGLPRFADHGDRRPQWRGAMLRQLHRTEIRCHDHHFAEPPLSRGRQFRHCGKHLNRYGAHGLERLRVRVHDDQPIRPRTCYRIGDHPGTQRLARPVAPILACVTEVRHHRGDPCCIRTSARVEEQQEFHQVLVDRGPVG